MLFIAAMSIVLFLSIRSGFLFPFVLPVCVGLTVFAANTDAWLYLWMLTGGLLATAVFFQPVYSAQGSPGTSFLFVLGAYLGTTIALLSAETTRKLGFWTVGLFAVLLFALATLLIPDVQ